MCELKEAVNVVLQLTEKDEYCKGVNAQHRGWNAKIDGFGATPTARKLFRNMKKADIPVPQKPDKKNGFWLLADCDKIKFPFQTHHLIPKKHLPTHNVCAWLTSKWNKEAPYKLSEDNNFDTDHFRNGYFMPFVSTCHEWQEATDENAKQKCAETMMKKTGIQLHQGMHTYEKITSEIDDIEPTGYLDVVDHLLELVHYRASLHVKNCTDCKTNEQKTEVQPLESVANHVYTVAEQLKRMIRSKNIFVSNRAEQCGSPRRS